MSRWFLPDDPDLLGNLQRQAAVTDAGLRAFVAWAAGDATQGQVVRDLEHDADGEVRRLRTTLRAAFVTPIDAEDLYALSARLDAVLNGAKNIVGEAEVMATPPDEPCARMAALLQAATARLLAAVTTLGRDADGATAAADAAVHEARQVEKVYRTAMSALLAEDDLRVVMSRRELYRRFARVADDVVEVAERIWYAVVKES